jgi:hypothetical protein
LAASILLRHAKEKPQEPAPFRFAIFICGSLPYWFETTQGVDVAGLFLKPSETGFGAPVGISYQPTKDDGSAEPKPMVESAMRRKSVALTVPEIESLERRLSLATLTDKHFSRVSISSVGSDFSSSSSDADSDDELPEVFSPEQLRSGSDSPLSSMDDSDDDEGYGWESKPGATVAGASGDHTVRRLHPASDTLRIGIPTAHIYGSKDPYYRQSLGLAGLCENTWASTYEHPEGHIVPRDMGVNQKIAATIERTLQLVDTFSR